ncbi:hypothetical protein D3C75_1342790 [compost metagenome]
MFRYGLLGGNDILIRPTHGAICGQKPRLCGLTRPFHNFSEPDILTMATFAHPAGIQPQTFDPPVIRQ